LLKGISSFQNLDGRKETIPAVHTPSGRLYSQIRQSALKRSKPDLTHPPITPCSRSAFYISKRR
jgi:hypothetical protein